MKSFNRHRTRREFVAQMIAGVVVAETVAIGGVRGDPGVEGESLAPTSQGAPAVSFFFDQPYWDSTGLDRPYRPPRGARSGQLLADLEEEELRSMFGWI